MWYLIGSPAGPACPACPDCDPGVPAVWRLEQHWDLSDCCGSDLFIYFLCCRWQAAMMVDVVSKL